jgi:hypothetical protein
MTAQYSTQDYAGVNDSKKFICNNKDLEQLKVLIKQEFNNFELVCIYQDNKGKQYDFDVFVLDTSDKKKLLGKIKSFIHHSQGNYFSFLAYKSVISKIKFKG